MWINLIKSSNSILVFGFQINGLQGSLIPASFIMVSVQKSCSFLSVFEEFEYTFIVLPVKLLIKTKAPSFWSIRLYPVLRKRFLGWGTGKRFSPTFLRSFLVENWGTVEGSHSSRVFLSLSGETSKKSLKPSPWKWLADKLHVVKQVWQKVLGACGIPASFSHTGLLSFSSFLLAPLEYQWEDKRTQTVRSSREI